MASDFQNAAAPRRPATPAPHERNASPRTEPEPATAAPGSLGPTMLVLQLLLLLAAVAFFVLGVYVAATEQTFVLMGLGLIAVLVGVVSLVLPSRLDTLRLIDATQRQNELLEAVHRGLFVSDAAIHVAQRHRERAALREAIHQDIRSGDYDSAAALVQQLAHTYGYREEAEDFGRQLHEAQQKQRERRIRQTLASIDELGRQGDWQQARQEADRLARLYPDHPEVEHLPQRVAEARERRKNELEREFLEAAEREDVERAMELLKELDRYLTWQEAAPFVETARGVIGKQRENLGVQFKKAVQDRDWVAALSVGEHIVRDFPNSKFAEEVREMIDDLRQRAREQKAAGEG